MNARLPSIVPLSLLTVAVACGPSDAAPAASTPQGAAPVVPDPARRPSAPPGQPAPPDTAGAPQSQQAPQAPQAQQAQQAATPQGQPGAPQAPSPALPVEGDEGDGARAPGKAAPQAQTKSNAAAPGQPQPPPAAAPVKPKYVAGAYRIEPASRASFLIDAPLEKIKGRWSKLGGELTIDPGNLAATRGSVTVDLMSLVTHTFGDAGKDRKQGEHALNWMEVGSDVDAQTRARHRTARFTIERVEGATSNVASPAPTQLVAHGKLLIHGRTVAARAKLEVTFEGPAAAPTAVRVRTRGPLMVSLKAHDVKPRDLAGRFLSGALEKVGQKIQDRVQVSVSLTASRR